MSQGDMFLKLETDRQGLVQGEVDDPGHPGEMAVQGWSWGMSSANAMGAGRATKTAISELKLTRLVDRGSIALMSIMRNNDRIKLATLSVRKASGDSPIDYFIVDVEGGRITSYETGSSGGPVLMESISIAFEKIEVTYHSQGNKGNKMGASTFMTDVGRVT